MNINLFYRIYNILPRKHMKSNQNCSLSEKINKKSLHKK